MKRSILGLRNWAKRKCEGIPLQFHVSCDVLVNVIYELIYTDPYSAQLETSRE